MGIQKTLAVLLVSLTSFSAFAETQLACWNMFAKKGSAPILVANIVRGDVLNSVTFNLKDEYFAPYLENTSKDSGEQWGHKPAITQSGLANPVGNLQGQLITTARSPYAGNDEFDIQLGGWKVDAPYIQQNGRYLARLILPRNLSNNFLQSFRIRSASERSNAVVILSPAHSTDQAGDNYLRLFCVSR